MNQTLAVWLLIALALVSANLPFLTERVFAVLRNETFEALFVRDVEQDAGKRRVVFDNQQHFVFRRDFGAVVADDYLHARAAFVLRLAGK